MIEYQIPIPKVCPPASEDDLRNIAKTSFASKVFESLLADFHLPIVQPYLDPYQFGLKGASINHYLIKLLKFIHQHLDLKNPHAVVLAMIDLSKAFNRLSHQKVIEDLNDMHVPPWLLRILSSYLSERSMIMYFNGVSSSPRVLNGSSPQGAFLGIFFFIIKFNGAALRPPVPRNSILHCPQSLAKCKDDICSTHDSTTHALYVDDLSELEAFDLKVKLTRDTANRPFPLNLHERTEHVLSGKSRLQENLEKT